MPKKNKEEAVQELTWRAAEYQFMEKSVGWYWFVIIAAIVLIFLAVLGRNFFFGVFVVLATAMVIFFGRKRPQVLDFKLSDKGVAIGENVFYDYDRLEGFMILEKPGRLDEIVLKKKAAINPFLKLPIDAKSGKDAEIILQGHLPPIQYEESLLDVVSDWFGF